MSYNTILQQGRFTADGTAERLAIRSDVDWMRVINWTIADADQTTAVGVQYYWQRGMPADRGIEYKKSNAANAVNLIDAMASGGFTLINDQTDPVLSASRVITAGTNAPQPVYDTGTTTGLATGSVVRLYTMTGQSELGGVDFEIDTVNAGVSFRVRYAMSQAPGAACTAGAYRIVNRDPSFYPTMRYIANITQATQAVVTMTVSHGYTVGQVVSFRIPGQVALGTMTELNGLNGSIVAVSASTITVDIDTSAFTAFNVPLATDAPVTWPQIVPVGEDTAAALTYGGDILGDAERNISIIGMSLATGANSPAGKNGEVIYWVAGKSFSVTNE